ncbi:MAG: Ig-like domain-containing protein, partial [Cyclobacteriaceae bacterium]
MYLFEKPQNGWEDAQETAILKESDKDGYTEFGKSIAIHGDTIVIGAPFATGSISSSGAVYLYVKPTDGWAYENFETAKLYESNPTTSNSTGRFGISVDIYNSTVVAGSPNFDSTFLDQGAILVFEKSGSNWSDMTETAKLVDVSPGNNNYLGSSVSIYGDTIFCAKLRNAELDEGSGHIYIKPSAGWVNNTEDAKLSVSLDFGDQIFSEVNVELTENIAVLTVSEQYPIGSASAKTYTGLGFVYQKGSGNWIDTSEDAVLKASDSIQNFRLGSSIALSQSRILLGSPGDNTNESSGSIFIYTSEGDWSGNLIENDRFAWTSELTLSAENDKFGTSVAISGNYAVAGSPYDDQVNINAGAAYVFKKSGDSWERIAKLTASDGTLDDQFGRSVAIYNDVIIVGSPNHDDEFNDQGAIYIYSKPESGWSDLTELQKIVAPTPKDEGYFGFAIDVHKGLIGVGSHNPGASNFEGEVILYQNLGGTFTQIAELYPSVSTEAYQFGVSVDVFEDQVIVGSGNAKVNLNRNQTKSFIYQRPDTGWQDMTESAILTRSGTERSTCLRCNFDRIDVQITDSIAFSSYPRLVTEDFSEDVSGQVLKFLTIDQNWVTATESSTLLANERTSNEAFSSSIGLSGDWLIAGNFFDSTDNKRSGKAYFFSNVLSDTSGQINENQYVVAETTSDEAEFGFDVSISGSTAIIGAPGESNETGPDAGSVYFFSSGEASIISVHSVNNGIFKTRDTVLIDVQFDREVQIIDKPLLVLFINDSTVRSATYRKQISPTEIRMQYIVNDGDVSSSLDYLNENSFLYGGTITDTELINANRVLPPIGAEASLAGSSSIILDADKPFPFFSGPKKASETFEVIIEFSRDLDEITIDDLSVQNGSIESSVIRNDSIFAIISPDKKGDIILFYKEGAFFDFKGTPNDSIGFVVEYDTIPPEISITSEISTLTNKPFEIKITFSEAINDVTENDVGLINATSNYFTASDDTLYLEVNPEVDGMVVVFYRNNSIFDLAGNGNDSTSFSIEYDATPPVISITSDAEDYINSSFETSVVFNEEVDDIDENDISLINATLSDFLVGEGSASFLVNPLEEGEVLVYYPNNQVFDLAGNGNDSTSFSIEYDATPPVISITSDAEDYINSSFETSVVFNEEVDTIDKNDVRLINATLSDFLASEGSASFLVNPLEEGEVLVYYPNNQVFDLAGNGNDSTSFS